MWSHAVAGSSASPAVPCIRARCTSWHGQKPTSAASKVHAPNSSSRTSSRNSPDLITWWARDTAAVRSMRAVEPSGIRTSRRPWWVRSMLWSSRATVLWVGAHSAFSRVIRNIAGQRPSGSASTSWTRGSPAKDALDQAGVEHRVVERVDTAVVELAPPADQGDRQVGQRAAEERVDRGHDRAVGKSRSCRGRPRGRGRRTGGRRGACCAARAAGRRGSSRCSR